ncbi:NTP/NDP exchange transporter [Flagellimonas myxillae]|uniref:NTP/NDP exchange transporter n=1 Tax=Flagellimonas myxillae TaxID=2942214 RepID=UPI00201F76B8|nr:MFS transporter [Muricauda myxillae]MCL6265762.1 MFS transporter [Muricauda myxillae]
MGIKNFFGFTPTQSKDKTPRLVAWSALYFFCLLCSYFILRPLRDEMGILNGAVNMQWLFTGTFVAMLAVVPIFGFLASRYSVDKILLYAYGFCISNILIFYLLFTIQGPSKGIAATFFIWLSVFNLFVVSLFWSFMADLFGSLASKKYFGIIAAGGSLGALVGPVIANVVGRYFSIGLLLLLAAFFLLMALCCIHFILKHRPEKVSDYKDDAKTVTLKKLFGGIRQVVRSPYLLGIVGFVLLYTSISTVLYFEQAHIVEQELPESADRIDYFSKLDFTINAIAIFGQFFLTAKLIQKIGLPLVLTSIPLLMAIGLFFLGQNATLPIIVVLMVLHRSGNFMLLRPGREILFTVTGFEEKYKAKNFIDTAVYRGGDALVGWIFAGVSAIGWSLGFIAFMTVPLSILWGLVGFRLGKSQLEKENALTLKDKMYEKHV